MLIADLVNIAELQMVSPTDIHACSIVNLGFDEVLDGL
jgi:hypothetical protein